MSIHLYLWNLAKGLQFEPTLNRPVKSSDPERRKGINLILNSCTYWEWELEEGPRPSDLVK